MYCTENLLIGTVEENNLSTYYQGLGFKHESQDSAKAKAYHRISLVDGAALLLRMHEVQVSSQYVHTYTAASFALLFMLIPG